MAEEGSGVRTSGFPRLPIASLVLLERGLDMLEYPLLFVDEEACIEFSNRAATALLGKDESPLHSVDGVLVARSPGLHSKLTRAIASACVEGRALGLRLEQKGPLAHATGHRLIIAPLHVAERTGCAAIWIVSEQSAGLPSAKMLSVLLALSPAEARLARSLLMGRTLDEHARHAGVGMTTVRTQLSKIFSKTGVRRQAELVALLAQIPALKLPEA